MEKGNCNGNFSLKGIIGECELMAARSEAEDFSILLKLILNKPYKSVLLAQVYATVA
ncbi:MAG TPA: hypothetical protein VI564_03045 [Candidatus Nanoarchaeia archaeon]|nr:hypothetical protein [Candidatus Nanoarchaeia archaeon]